MDLLLTVIALYMLYVFVTTLVCYMVHFIPAMGHIDGMQERPRKDQAAIHIGYLISSVMDVNRKFVILLTVPNYLVQKKIIEGMKTL
jgi:hypothetical protein